MSRLQDGLGAAPFSDARAAVLQQLALSIGLVHSDELAKLFGYAGPNDAFRTFCRGIGILHVPGRPGYFDPILVRQRLNEAQGLISNGAPKQPMTEVEKFKQRKAQQHGKG